jgi:hypothetical protein
VRGGKDEVRKRREVRTQTLFMFSASFFPDHRKSVDSPSPPSFVDELMCLCRQRM